jgi:hypothetical protein
MVSNVWVHRKNKMIEITILKIVKQYGLKKLKMSFDSTKS